MFIHIIIFANIRNMKINVMPNSFSIKNLCVFLFLVVKIKKEDKIPNIPEIVPKNISIKVKKLFCII